MPHLQIKFKNFFLISLLTVVASSCSVDKSEFIEQVENKDIENIINTVTDKIYNSRISNEFGPCGSEYIDGRRYSFLDINNDSNEDLIVFMVFEGLNCGSTGSDSHKFLLVSENDNGLYRFHSMTKFKFGGEVIQTDYIKKSGDKLILNTFTYGPNDPMCCPSKESKLNISINSLNKNWLVADIK